MKAIICVGISRSQTPSWDRCRLQAAYDQTHDGSPQWLEALRYGLLWKCQEWKWIAPVCGALVLGHGPVSERVWPKTLPRILSIVMPRKLPRSHWSPFLFQKMINDDSYNDCHGNDDEEDDVNNDNNIINNIDNDNNCRWFYCQYYNFHLHYYH